MNFSIVHSAQNNILEASGVDIEADITNGLYSFNIVGLADKAVDESKDRISSAIKNSGFLSPKKRNQKIVISLAPANIRKSGPNFDLPMALAYLKSAGDIDFKSNKKIFIGELSLDGKLRKVSGILPIIIFAKKHGFSEVFLPEQNAEEASLIGGIKIFSFSRLSDVINHITSKKIKKNLEKNTNCINKNTKVLLDDDPGWFYIKGQNKAKRALHIAAAGGHNLGLYGPPGTGKTLLARSIKSILPKLNYNQIIETTSIHSVADLSGGLIQDPPFRNPHHTSSYSALIGGGTYLKPGEISLAHNGVLFLDEMPEFDQKVIDSLRQPIEDKHIMLSRLHQKSKLPTNFILIIAMNPCPCGYYKSNARICTCSINSIEKYRKKISGPIIDRIDMWVEVNNQKFKDYNKNQKINNHLGHLEFKEIKNSVVCARSRQYRRHGGFILNSDISHKKIEDTCKLKPDTQSIMAMAMDKLSLSIRSYHNILKVSRTIADIDNSRTIKEKHILEAIQYRNKLI